MAFLFRAFRAEGGCNSFILADVRSGRACVVDPSVGELQAYEQLLGARGLTLAYAVDTHTHADHYSATHLAARRLGARVAMSAETRSARPHARLRDGEALEIAPGLALEILHTPGHTPDSACFVARGPWGALVMTGDTLFIGGSGRTDFPGADPLAQFESIRSKLGALDGSTWVFPGHDYSDLLLSTIALEKASNPHWRIASRDDFARVKRAEALESPGVIQQIVDFNLSADPQHTPRVGAHVACASTCVGADPSAKREDAAEWRELLSGRPAAGLFIDVREPEEAAETRIDGTVNIPLSELFLHWEELRRAPAVRFACQQGARSWVAARTARRLGLSGATDLRGGILGWIAAGYPVTRR